MLKEGDIELIYIDPYARTKPEGEAKLIKRLPPRKFAKEYWKVKFIKDDSVADRFIVPENKSN